MSKLLPEKQRERATEFLRNLVLRSYSQSEISRQTTIAQSTLSDILHGRRNISLQVVKGLSALTGKEIEHIMGEVRSPQSENLGHMPGYAEAEEHLRKHVMTHATSEFWMNLRYINFPTPFAWVSHDLLYALASTAQRGWIENNRLKEDTWLVPR